MTPISDVDELLDARGRQLTRRVAEAIDAEREALNARNMLNSGIASRDTVARASATIEEGVREVAGDLETFNLRLGAWDSVGRNAAELVDSIGEKAWRGLEGFYGDIDAFRPRLDEALANARAHLTVACNRGREAAWERRRTVTWDAVKIVVGAILGYVVAILT